MYKLAYKQGVVDALYDLGVIGDRVQEKRAGVAEIVQRLRGMASGAGEAISGAGGKAMEMLRGMSPAQQAALAAGGGGVVGATAGAAGSDSPLSGALLGGLAGAGLGAGARLGIPRLQALLKSRGAAAEAAGKGFAEGGGGYGGGFLNLGDPARYVRA